ncbi:MAG: hypothetical protein JW782_01350 [Candidatus Saganbacteria bacterium]|nr:hypothetical protein [Candidatus Saganbacteria bacterium]
MRICIDIDNVIADTFNSLIPLYNRFMGREHTAQEVTETMRRNRWKLLRYYFMAWRRQIMTKIPLIDGAAEAIRDWSNDHDISLVTSRLPLFKRQTRQWLSQNQIPFHELHHVKELTKHEKANGCQLFIEDNIRECEVLADHCERVFLVDHPWNRQAVSKPNIVRVSNWQEIRQKF